MDLINNKKLQTIAMIGGLVGFAGLIITVIKSKPVASFLASVKSK